MAQCFIRIKTRPDGGAPEHIRDAWVGCVLPVLDEYKGLLGDVLNHSLVTDRMGGYAVTWDDAMEALGKVHPEARKWWERNVRPITLVFDKDCCEIVPD